MRKSNKAHSQRGLKRHQKNADRLKRKQEMNDFNRLAQAVKIMQKVIDRTKP